MRHYVTVGILVIVVTILTYAGLYSVNLLPVAASLQAGSINDVGSIDWLWNWELVVMCFLFSLIAVPMFYSFVVFRRIKGDTSDGEHMEGNTKLEIAWTVLPLVLVFAFAYMGAYSLGDIRRIDPDAMNIKVRAQQFTWTFEYPEYGFFSNELHVPVDQQVVLKMTSTDVIHSFWVPEFRIKQDVVPGRTTEYIVTPTLIGPYKVRCAELCGTSHYKMENVVIVESRANFDVWVAEQAALAAEAALTPEGQGQLLSVKNGCSGCHSVDGTRLTGPTWFGIYGADVELADGRTVVVDDAFIIESILDPKAKEVAGFSPTSMPTYATVLTEEEIAHIIAYIKTLR